MHECAYKIDSTAPREIGLIMSNLIRSRSKFVQGRTQWIALQGIRGLKVVTAERFDVQ